MSQEVSELLPSLCSRVMWTPGAPGGTSRIETPAAPALPRSVRQAVTRKAAAPGSDSASANWASPRINGGSRASRCAGEP